MTSFTTGRLAEEAAAAHLIRLGYAILDRNWRTKWCEIDIVTSKNDCVYFIEVKYRKNAHYGDGLDYVTPRKQDQMRRAALSWTQAHRYLGDYNLSAISVTGPDYAVEDFIPSILF